MFGSSILNNGISISFSSQQKSLFSSSDIDCLKKGAFHFSDYVRLISLVHMLSLIFLLLSVQYSPTMTVRCFAGKKRILDQETVKFNVNIRLLSEKLLRRQSEFFQFVDVPMYTIKQSSAIVEGTSILAGLCRTDYCNNRKTTKKV